MTFIFPVFLGALVGSFLNVVISRIPAQIDYAERQTDSASGDNAPPPGIAWPGSHCPHCKHPIRIRDNIPIISWLLLRGRCRDCDAPISPRYPFTEALTAIVFAAVVAWYGIEPITAVLLLLSGWMIAMAIIDFETHLLPDALTLSGLWIGLLVSVGTDFITPTMSIIGAAAGYSSLWLINAGYRLLRGIEGLGYGDFKLFALIGAWGGPEALLATILIAPIAALLIILAQAPLMGIDGQREIPFGPYLAVAGWIAITAPPSLAVYLPPWG
ncbi:prepilin peptidase [Spiribacter vilamensis]|uniref:Prepilin leader peptidase/N-methyltransferase n=1 Tax=Spiribacter vilamensis TaxID=531306 RepID=A0A4Q8D035_9GAMM|nr:A24 family peptidase [Spiribacter vilamensis]RZU98612.1 type 4 prepilin peptidase 1 [Spiribacter vilamensis]TVO60130.1 prepilin peptidase [Spiribacter vilamensis]